MRLAVTGHNGQLVRALIEAAPRTTSCTVVALGRPGFDLSRIETLAPAIAALNPDIVVNAAAYTAVDKAESDADAALLVNGAASGAIAAICARLSIPIIQISTDCVFDGASAGPYRETDPTCPISVYGASKTLGEQLVGAAGPRHLILRTSWVISAYGTNFAKTMLRLGAERSKLTIVDDQHGAPTYAPHLAEAILQLAKTMVIAPSDDPRWGIYHVTNAGVTTWCGLAREVFANAARHGTKAPDIVAIATSDYPTPARRPANSRLDGHKLAATFGITLPPWQTGVRLTVDQLLAPSELTKGPRQ